MKILIFVCCVLVLLTPILTKGDHIVKSDATKEEDNSPTTPLDSNEKDINIVGKSNINLNDVVPHGINGIGINGQHVGIDKKGVEIGNGITSTNIGIGNKGVELSHNINIVDGGINSIPIDQDMTDVVPKADFNNGITVPVNIGNHVVPMSVNSATTDKDGIPIVNNADDIDLSNDPLNEDKVAEINKLNGVVTTDVNGIPVESGNNLPDIVRQPDMLNDPTIGESTKVVYQTNHIRIGETPPPTDEPTETDAPTETPTSPDVVVEEEGDDCCEGPKGTMPTASDLDGFVKG